MKTLSGRDAIRATGRWNWMLPAPLLMLAMGCSMSEAVGQIPEATAELRVPAGVPTSRIFECARSRLSQLRAEEALWDHAVSAEDVGRGLLETGNFPDDNVSGFRVQLRHDVEAGLVSVRLRGAGAYFVDQGVDDALGEFREGFEPCVSAITVG